MLAVDLATLAYWLVAALAAAAVVRLPPELMYAGYGERFTDAWNWSFMPLDICFALMGMAAVWRARRGQRWRGYAIASLALMACAGGMALSFWLLIGFFDWNWWGPNLVLLALPLLFLPRLMRES